MQEPQSGDKSEISLENRRIDVNHEAGTDMNAQKAKAQVIDRGKIYNGKVCSSSDIARICERHFISLSRDRALAIA